MVKEKIHPKQSKYNPAQHFLMNGCNKNPIETKSMKWKRAYMVIKNTVCDYYGLDRKEVFQKSRKRMYVLPRQICSYLMRDWNRANITYGLNAKKAYNGYSMISWSIYDREDHASIMYSCKTIEALTDPRFGDYELMDDLRKIRAHLIGVEDLVL